VLGTNGINLFAVQGRMDDPGHRRVTRRVVGMPWRMRSIIGPCRRHNRLPCACARCRAGSRRHGRPMMMGP
jgi:hypothetical protein